MQIIIKNGRVFDGNRFLGEVDVLIVEDKIRNIGRFNPETYAEATVIDATDKIVSPGFVDIHANSSAQQLEESDGASALAQGVTTQVVGHCGRSGDYYSIIEQALDHITRYTHISTPVNIGTLFGHNTLRQVVMEGNQERPCTDDELADMLSVTERAIDRGAIGFSTGLMYSPRWFADKREIVELLRLVNSKRGLYATHMRDEGDNVIESVEETIRMAESASIPVQISHHKIVGTQHIGKSKKTLERIRASRAKGNVVTLDIYPYTATSTYMKIILPKVLIKRFGDEVSAIPHNLEVLTEIDQEGIHNYCPNLWEDVLVTVCENPEYSGKTIADIAGSDNPPQTFLRILQEDPKVYAVFLNIISQQDLDNVVRDSECYIASDGYIYDTSFTDMTHPRSYGTFPLILRDYVLTREILSLDEALRKMTSQPAQRFNIKGRGTIKPDSYADIIVFTLDKLKNTETYENPTQLAEGVNFVLVNGEIAYQNGKATNVKSGVFIS